MDEKKTSPLAGIAESQQEEAENLGEKAASKLSKGQSKTAKDNGSLQFLTREHLDLIQHDQNESFKELATRIDRVQQAVIGIRSLTFLALALAGYSFFKVRKLTTEGGVKNGEQTTGLDSKPEIGNTEA